MIYLTYSMSILIINLYNFYLYYACMALMWLQIKILQPLFYHLIVLNFTLELFFVPINESQVL